MRVKVCHVTSAHKRYDTRIFQKECTSLAENGYDVTLIVADGEDEEVVNGVKIVSVDFYAKNRIQRFTKLRKYIIKKVIEIDAEIYHFHDPELLLIAKKLKHLGKKVIFDSHELYKEQIKLKHYIPLVLRALIAKTYGVMEIAVYRKIDAVIFPCTLEKKHPFEGKCKKCVIIDNYPKLHDFYNQYTEDRYNQSSHGVCYTGTISESRGITQVVTACGNIGTKLILAGGFSPPEYLEQLRSKKEFECVDYRGYCSKEEIIQIYKEASIGVSILPDKGQYRKAENFPTKVLEFLSMGLPAILNNSPYNKKIMEELEFGVLVDDRNIREISEAIKLLTDNESLCRRLGTNGRKLILERFNWGFEEKKLISLYKELTCEEKEQKCGF